MTLALVPTDLRFLFFKINTNETAVRTKRIFPQVYQEKTILAFE
jgi:hypothetical protein